MKRVKFLSLLICLVLFTTSFAGSATAFDLDSEGNLTASSVSSATCYNCGRSYMNLYTYIVSGAAGSGLITCPHVVPPEMISEVESERQDPPRGDFFTVYEHWSYEKCTYCKYESSHWLSFKSYDATCYNGDFPASEDSSPQDPNAWEVRLEYRPSTTGCNIHKSLRYWLYRDKT